MRQYVKPQVPANTNTSAACVKPQRRMPPNVTNWIERDVDATYRRHARCLFHVALHLSGRQEAAEEILQETFLRYVQALQSGEEIRNAKAWLFRVARNCSLTWRKRNGDRDRLHPGPNEQDHHQDPTASYERVELVRQFCGRLTPRESACVRLRAEGLSYAEIADLLGIRSGTVAALLARALDKCRKLLGVERD
jgi:RNA polymerase sigma-70 factor (ECF subfamily)